MSDISIQLQKLVIASGNTGKIKEFRAYLADLGVTLILKPDSIDVEETGITFIENAHLKASQVAIATNEWAIADDSGLQVDALDGAPGIYSARYANSDKERIDRMLAELSNFPDSSQRQAQFVCAVAVARPDGSLLAYQPYGKHGLLIADVDLATATGLLASRCKADAYGDD